MSSCPVKLFSSKQPAAKLPRRSFIANLAAASAFLPALAQSERKADPSIRLACQTNAWPFPSGLSGLLPVLKTIKSLGFQGYETSFRNLEASYSDAPRVRAILEETGLTCAGVHIAAPSRYLPETSIPPMDFLRKTAAGASALGAESLILSGRGIREINGKLDQDALKGKIAAKLEIAQYCQDKGLKLVYHNHADDFIQDGAEIDALLSASKPGTVGVWFCVHNSRRAGVDVVKYFSSHHESISGIHLTNILDESPHGHRFDSEALQAEIEKVNWKGWLVIEEERTRERPEWPQTPVVKKSRQHVRQVFGL